MNNTKDNLEYRGVTKEELLYSEIQPTYQLSAMSGCVGYVTGEIRNGKEKQGPLNHDAFVSVCANLKTADFLMSYTHCVKQLGEVILTSADAVQDYCNRHTHFAVEGAVMVQKSIFTFTHEGYMYFVTLRPGVPVAEYMIIVYHHNTLYEFREKAGKGIRFITLSYDEIFRIKDGGSVEFSFDNGEKDIHKCRYYDDYHFWIDGNVFHICEFAERIQKSTICSIKPVTEEE